MKTKYMTSSGFGRFIKICRRFQRRFEGTIFSRG